VFDEKVDPIDFESVRQWLKVYGPLKRSLEGLREGVGYLVLDVGQMTRSQG